uniref:Pleckstrin homology domain-containing family B member 2 n=1 Tax=Marmota marmota marmota TaxID=9994 RepID=A0A8C5YUV1_MARMA
MAFVKRHECQDIQPPDGKPKACMLQIVCRDEKTISLCAESTDDCLAWKFALQEPRTNIVYIGSEKIVMAVSPSPYTVYTAPTAYGYCSYSGAYPSGTQVLYVAKVQADSVPYQFPYAGLDAQQSAIQVIIHELNRENNSDLALGMLAGVATGMALGSLFWSFQSLQGLNVLSF